MILRLTGALGEVARLFPEASHPLRTLLTRIRGELDLVLRSDVAEPPRSQLEGIRDEVELLNRVCRRLLLLARLDEQARDASLLVERVDLEELVFELLDQTTPLARDRDGALRHRKSSPVAVRGSRPSSWRPS